MLRKSELAPRNLLVQILIRGAAERKLATEHRVEEDAGSPDICWRPNVLLLHDYLGAHVRRRTTEHLQFDIAGGTAAKAKIDELNAVFLRFNNDILQLDVPMRHIARVKVHQRAEHLLNYPFRLVLWEASLVLCLQVRVKTLTLGIFHHQIDVLGRVYSLIELDNVGMGQTAQYSDLSNRLFLALRVTQLGSVVLLDGDLLTAGLVNALFDDGVGAYTDLVAHVVHAQVVAIGCREFLRLQSTAAVGLRISAA